MFLQTVANAYRPPGIPNLLLERLPTKHRKLLVPQKFRSQDTCAALLVGQSTIGMNALLHFPMVSLNRSVVALYLFPIILKFTEGLVTQI